MLSAKKFKIYDESNGARDWNHVYKTWFYFLSVTKKGNEKNN